MIKKIGVPQGPTLRSYQFLFYTNAKYQVFFWLAYWKPFPSDFISSFFFSGISRIVVGFREVERQKKDRTKLRQCRVNEVITLQVDKMPKSRKNIMTKYLSAFLDDIKAQVCEKGSHDHWW